MVPFAGHLMPLEYTSVKEEALAVRNSVGMFDVSHMGEFSINGREALKFIDHLLPNDLSNPPYGKAIYSPLCDQDGKILDDLIVYKLKPQKILVCVNAINIKKDWEWFRERSTSFDCSLEDRSEETALIALQGPTSSSVIKQLWSHKLASYSAYTAKWRDLEVVVARTGYTGEDGFEIFSPLCIVEEIWIKLLELKVKPCGLAARDLLRLEACYPLFGNELTEDLTPFDCGLRWTVKSNGTDFIGSSALENATPRHQLIKLSLTSGIPRQGQFLFNERKKKIGIITSGTYSIILKKGIALARVDKEFSKDDLFFVEIRGRLYPANYHSKPFISTRR